MKQRQCTQNYKIKPVLQKTREIIGRRPRISSARPPFVVQWMGISTDEWMRCKDARVGWTENAYPLIEAGMSRADCVSWFNEHYPGQPIAKSSCVGCPFHSSREMVDVVPATTLTAWREPSPWTNTCENQPASPSRRTASQSTYTPACAHLLKC